MDDENSMLSITGVDKVVGDIYDYAKKINTEINNISEIIMKTDTYYNTPDGFKFREKFKKFSGDTQELNKNILSIATDLVYIKEKYQKREYGAVQIIRDAELEQKKKIS